MIYVTEKKVVLCNEVSLDCKNTDHGSAINPVALEKLENCACEGYHWKHPPVFPKARRVYGFVSLNETLPWS